jgi:hypothetical protein
MPSAISVTGFSVACRAISSAVGIVMTSEPPAPLTTSLLAIVAPRWRLSSRAMTKPMGRLLVIKHNRVARGDEVAPLILRDERAAGRAPAASPFN